MADAQQIAELRRLIDEPDATTYSDDTLGNRIDATGVDDLYQLASTIWREKAASYSGLIDVREGTSDRKMSQLQTMALRMADTMALGESGVLVVRRSARTRKIERQ